MSAELFDDETLRAGTDEAVYFLQRFHPDRMIHLAAIGEDGKIVPRSFSPDEDKEMRKWVRSQQRSRNVYHHINGLRFLVRNGKAKKEDIEEANALHVDIDDLRGLARLGSGLIDQIQKMTVAAMQMAEKKV